MWERIINFRRLADVRQAFFSSIPEVRMRFRFFRQVAVVLVFAGAGGASAYAQSKGQSRSSEVGDRGMDKQMDWENKVMGDDSAKRADMKKIAAAQKVADQARKHPAPEPVAKVKDPSKEGVRAKQEAAIGLPIASEEEAAHHAKKTSTAKKSVAPSSANDELGALVASSLAADKAAPAPPTKGKPAKTKGKHVKAKASSSSLDDMFANQAN
jgi:hypothetical protein